MSCSSVAGKFSLAVILCSLCSQSCICKLQKACLLYSSGSVAGKFSPTAAVILCSSSHVVPSCMQAAEGAHCSYCSIVPRRGAKCHGGVVEQEEMVTTKSGPSDKSS